MWYPCIRHKNEHGSGNFHGGIWMCVLEKHTEIYGGPRFLLKCNFDAEQLNDIPTFYREILQCSQEIITINHAIIWNNEYINIDNRSLYWSTWHNHARNNIYTRSTGRFQLYYLSRDMWKI